MPLKAIKSLTNPFVKHLVKLRKDRDYRYEQGRVLILDPKVIRELPQKILHTFCLSESSAGAEDILVSPEVMAKISGQASPPFFAAEVEMPQARLPQKLQRLLILEHVSDPGNMGTLFRTALAFAWDAIFLVGSCCDPFNNKALQASKGAFFRLPFLTGSWQEAEDLCKSHNLEILLADLAGEDPERAAASRRQNAYALVLGNEGQGLSSEALTKGRVISLPMAELSESLNVGIAGGVLMYLLSPKRGENHV